MLWRSLPILESGSPQFNKRELHTFMSPTLLGHLKQNTLGTSTSAIRRMKTYPVGFSEKFLSGN